MADILQLPGDIEQVDGDLGGQLHQLQMHEQRFGVENIYISIERRLQENLIRITQTVTQVALYVT